MRGIAYRKSAAARFLSTDYVFILACFAGTILLVMVSIEVGYRAARIAHRHSRPEKESPVSAIEGSVLALLAFILAFTFGIASNRFDARRELVRMEANAIRTAWYRSEFLSDSERMETRTLLREYLRARTLAFQSAEEERIDRVIDEAERTQARLWSMAVAQARRDMNSEAGALYVESLNGRDR